MPHDTDPRIAPALAWLPGHARPISRIRSCELITGGRSNLTYRLSDTSGQRWIIRRPPTGPLLPRAHDMHREFRLLTALHTRTSVPVPEPIILCDDVQVIGVPFYVMAEVPGAVLRTPADARALSPGVRNAAADNAIGVLATLHCVDIDAVGLADVGRPGGYVSRQLQRWLRQVEETNDRAVIPAVARQQHALTGATPPDTPSVLVHGDYRFDNLVIEPQRGSVRAVLDWEIATIGDPLADLASMLVCWDQPGDERGALGSVGPTAEQGFPSRSEAAQSYAAVTGFPLGNLNFYLAFGYWKLACVLHGVAHRYKAGDGGGAVEPPPDMNHLRWLLQQSADYLSLHQRQAGRADAR